MELIIKLSKEDYEIMKHNVEMHNPLCPLNQEDMVTIIANGVPLPEGHDRLIYAKDVGEYLTLADVPTIIEADVPKRRKGTPLEENDNGYNCENWIP